MEKCRNGKKEDKILGKKKYRCAKKNKYYDL